MKERVYVFDQSNRMLPNPTRALAHVRGLEWETMLPGGFGLASFEVPMGFLRGWDVSLAHTLRIYDGIQRLYTGRIEDLTQLVNLPGPPTEGRRRVQAFGWWQELRQRLFTRAYTAGTVYARDVVFDVLAQCGPHLSGNHIDIANPGVNLVPRTWTNQYGANVIEDLLRYGDDQTPPRQWLFAIWGEADRYGTIINSDWHEGAASNTPIDPLWDGKIAATGTISIVGGYLRCNAPDDVAKAAMVVGAKTLPADRNWRIEHKFRSTPSNHWFVAIGLKNSATQPVLTGAANQDWPDLFIRLHADGKVKMYYMDNAGTDWWWNGAAWQDAEATAYAGAVGTFYVARFASDSTGWWMELESAAGASLAKTSAVTWASTASMTSGIWCLFGDYATNYAYGTLDSEYIRVFAKNSLPVAEFWPRDPSTYDLQIPLSSIRGELALTKTPGRTANKVIATYDSTATAAASNAASIARYHQRDYNVQAGGVSAAVAAIARDMYLERHKDESHQLSPITVRGHVRNKAGARHPLNRVRAGDRFIVPEMGSTVYMISHTRYTADTGELKIDIDEAPETVEYMLAQALKK